VKLAEKMERGPIFIGGLDRCGKTMLRAFLVSHPHISIPAIGSNMWTYFYGKYGALDQPEHFEKCLTALLRYKHVRFLKPDPLRIRCEFQQGPATYARLFALIQQHHAERMGKPRWGDQSGLIERYADLILRAYPDARMIHMMRDPRDRYEASLTRWTEGKARAGGATARWLYSARLARRNAAHYPDRYLIVRYEELVSSPDETLRKVCSFLHEDFDSAMLTLCGADGYRAKLLQNARAVGAASLINTAYIGRFRNHVAPGEIAFIQTFAAAEMRAFGYTPDPLLLSPAEHLRFWLIDRPLNLVRFMAWYGVELAQQNFPSLVGRMPARNKWLSS